MAKNQRKKKSKNESEKLQGSYAGYSLISDYDVDLFRTGRHFKLYEKFGAHCVNIGKVSGTYFAVWAPGATNVSVIGNFNHWNKGANALNVRWDSSGIWEGFIPEVGHGELYKFAITTREGKVLEKGDPFATYWEEAPRTGSIVWDLDYKWSDKIWMDDRKKTAGLSQPFSVYELHFGSWKRKTEGNNRSLTYKEMAVELAAYISKLGYTHVEFMPLMEHPFYGSWGYQITGYYAATSRYGNPQELMYLVEELHKTGIGVIFDWVPSHFPGDEYGLAKFDGTAIYEHPDPRKGFHPDWKSFIFDYGRNEVRSFLISNAIFWLDRYHIDGLRVDAVASMLYLDYSREEGEWVPNEHGGNENLDTISFLRELNETVYSEFPDAITIAEESTSWPMVSRPTYTGGLGFGQKWMMGWMHDSLEYFKRDPIHRKFHLNEITFSLLYAFTENFMLPLSHDEVVYGKGSLIGRMPGDDWQKFANLRLLYGLMYAHPGTKLLFMGGEFGQFEEWDHENSLDWHLLDNDIHSGMLEWVSALNAVYKKEKALYELQFEHNGFEWIDNTNFDKSIISFLRKGKNYKNDVIAICNFTPAPHKDYRIGVPHEGAWKEIINSDSEKYGGSGVVNENPLKTSPESYHGRAQSITLSIPPLGFTLLGLHHGKDDFKYSGS